MKTFTLFTLIENKSLTTGKSRAEITDEASELLGITRQTFGTLCRTRGNARPPVKHLLILSKYFECSIDELISPVYTQSILKSTAQ